MIKTNPVSEEFKNLLTMSKDRILIAVPFLSGFCRTMLNDCPEVVDKRMLIRFDSSSLSSFDIPSMQYLISKGFSLRFLNSLHMKMYILGENTIISSGNLTQGGLEDNDELSVINPVGHSQCLSIFHDLWLKAEKNSISEDLLEQSKPEYKLLVSRSKARTKPRMHVQIAGNVGSLSRETLFNQIFRTEFLEFESGQPNVLLAQETRQKRVQGIGDAMDLNILYAPEGHPLRKDCLFYDLEYGAEGFLAGTGLVENQFAALFTHPDVLDVLRFCLPENFGLPPWGLDEPSQYEAFCEGVFDFNIPQYKETLPIRLASYFHPNHFLPIFKLDQLQNIAAAMGHKNLSAYASKGQELASLNLFFKDVTEAIPTNNYIKSQMAYAFYFTSYMYEKFVEGKTYQEVIESYPKQKRWIRNYFEGAQTRLQNLGVI